MGLIRRVLDARKIEGPDRDSLEMALSHLALINKMRNEILHFGVVVAEGGDLVVSNKLVAHVEKRLRETTISSQTLDNMTYDLDKIGVHLTVFTWRILAPGIEIKVPEFHVRLRRPWRYKQPAPATRDH
jgi:hypothetical protein